MVDGDDVSPVEVDGEVVDGSLVERDGALVDGEPVDGVLVDGVLVDGKPVDSAGDECLVPVERPADSGSTPGVVASSAEEGEVLVSERADPEVP